MNVKVGIFGWGDIAREHASHLPAAGAILGGVVSRQANPLLHLPDVPIYRSLEDMLPHVDAVTIAVPNHLHASSCLLALDAGKAVMVEKPLAITRRELDDLGNSLERQRVPVHLGYRLRWNPTLRRLREEIEGLRRVRCNYRMGIEPLAEGKDWTRRFAFTGGAFFTLGVHALDLARWLAGSRGEALADLGAVAEHEDHSADYPLCVSLSGTLPNGVEIVAGADLRGSAESQIQLQVEADRGTYPDPSMPAPVPGDEKIEYSGLISNFIRAVEAGTVDSGETREFIQTHRELLQMRDLSHNMSRR